MNHIPSEIELMEWFGCEPVVTGDAQYSYTILDSTGVSLLFSYDIIEASVQTSLKFCNVIVIKVVSERASRLWFEELSGEKRMKVEFLMDGSRGLLCIELRPRIKVEWATLSV